MNCHPESAVADEGPAFPPGAMVKAVRILVPPRKQRLVFLKTNTRATESRSFASLRMTNQMCC